MTPITATNPQIHATKETPLSAKTQPEAPHDFSELHLTMPQLALSICNSSVSFKRT
jgi:hypothetical protein